MKKLLLMLVVTLVVGCGSSYKEPVATAAPVNNNNTIITPLDAEAIHVLGLEVHDILGRPTGADLEGAVRFTDVVASLYTLNTSGPGPLGGSVAVNQGTIVFDDYATTGGAIINGVVVRNGATLTFQDLVFVDSVAEVDKVNGTIQVALVMGNPITELTVTSNFSNQFDNDDSVLTLVDHVSHRAIDSSDPQNIVTTVSDTGQVRIQHGSIDYSAIITMPQPLVTTVDGLQSGQILLTGIAPSQQNLRFDVVPGGEHYQVYLQNGPGQPFQLITTI